MELEEELNDYMMANEVRGYASIRVHQTTGEKQAGLYLVVDGCIFMDGQHATHGQYRIMFHEDGLKALASQLSDFADEIAGLT